MAKGFNRGGMMGGGGGGGNMLNQIRKMQDQMEVIQAQLAIDTVTATSGGGAVKVTMTGDQKCTKIEINPEILKDPDAEMLQDMVLSAVNLALDDSRKLAADRMGPLAGGIPSLGF